MMRSYLGAVLAAVLSLGVMGCSHLPGKPGFRPETMRPDQVHDFATLYRQNCSACHGDNGRNGAALPLNNPVYLEWAGRNRMVGIVSNGVPQSMMPAFGPGGGGLLTDQQVKDIVDGMMTRWGKPGVLNGTNAPGYAASSAGDAAQGQEAFQTYCARCHEANGEGSAAWKGGLASGAVANAASATGSIVDPTYLALISSQGLRDIIVSGMPGEDMPDWRGDVDGKPMTDSDVTNIVAWMESHRAQAPGRSAASARPRRGRQAQQNLGSSGKNRRRLPQ